MSRQGRTPADCWSTWPPAARICCTAPQVEAPRQILVQTPRLFSEQVSRFPTAQPERGQGGREPPVGLTPKFDADEALALQGLTVVVSRSSGLSLHDLISPDTYMRLACRPVQVPSATAL